MAELNELAVIEKKTLTDIADAIRAKGGASEPMLPSEMPGRIEAIPGGGGDLTRIAESVKVMDGITRENPDEMELARAITEITRQPNRRGEAVADEPEWAAGQDSTAFVVKVDESVGLDFIVGCLWLKDGSASATIDWGDGTTSTVTQSGVVCEKHLYAEAGCYLVQISDDITRFLPHLNDVTSANFSSSNGRRPQGDWCTAMFDSSRSYAKANNDNIDKVYRVIQWGKSITSASNTYNGCSGLTGTIPEWGGNITTASSTYYSCSGLTGAIPAWGAKITSAYATYYSCSGLTGTVPEWGAKITRADLTYHSCSGLTGAIPAWGVIITNASNTYYGCSGMTGTIPEWGAEITNASNTYNGCSGLTGTIPAWGAKITNAQETYRWCLGLTSIWDVEASDSDRMPSHITTKTNCVNDTSQALRALFLVAWGGTRDS